MLLASLNIKINLSTCGKLSFDQKVEFDKSDELALHLARAAWVLRVIRSYSNDLVVLYRIENMQTTIIANRVRLNVQISRALKGWHTTMCLKQQNIIEKLVMLILAKPCIYVGSNKKIGYFCISTYTANLHNCLTVLTKGYSDSKEALGR